VGLELPQIGDLRLATKAAPALLHRFGGFAVSLVFSTLVNLLAIPFVISTLGKGIWGELALAQATAALFGILVAYGWGTVGAAMVASLPVYERPQMYLDSLVSRSYLFLFAAPVMFLAVLVISRVDPIVAAVAAVAYLLPFLGASWYFVGQAKPWQLLVFDVLPQGLGVVTGVVLMMFMPHAYTFVGSLLFFNLLAVILGATGALRSRPSQPLKRNLALVPAMRRLRDQRHGVIAAGTGSLNSNLPLLVVNQVVQAALPQYAMADKLFRFAVAGFGPVLQVIQGWIPEAGVSASRNRIRVVARLAPAAGLLAGVVLAALTPWASSAFSGGSINIGLELSAPFGVILAGVIVAQIVGLACLIPLGKGAALAKSTAIGAALNVPLMILLGFAFGAPGVAWAVGLAELVVASYQLLVVGTTLRHLARAEPASASEPRK
jgi:O-antigen/teichoic acid export membrane protein